jgi:hypothetical protein
MYPINEKGLVSSFNGSRWYEEYGSEEMPAHVLNGFIFSLSGIVSFNKVYKDELSQKIFENGIDYLKHSISLYDFNFTSRYDYSPLNQLASTKSGPDGYHELHIFQLGWLYKISGIDIIQEYTHLFLKQDMGGIKSVYRLYNESKDIKDIKASYSIEPINYGVDKLIDANWTWDKYWSSNRFPVDLSLALNDDVMDEGVIEKISISSVSKSDFPSSFNVYEILDNGNERLIKENISTSNMSHVDYEHDINGYSSYTVVFDLNIDVASKFILIRFNGADEGIIRLRELDFQYPKYSLLNKIINFYDYP